MNIPWKTIISTVISIGFGFALGLAAHHWLRPPPHPPMHHLRAKNPGMHFIERMSKKLELNQEQEEKIKKVFTQHSEKMKALHDEIFPKIEKTRKTIDSDIKKILTEEQIKKFDAFIEQRKKFRKGLFGKGPRHHKKGRRHRGRHRGPHHGLEDQGAPPPPPPPLEEEQN